MIACGVTCILNERDKLHQASIADCLTRQSNATQDKTRQSKTKQGERRLSKAKQDKVGYDKA